MFFEFKRHVILPRHISCSCLCVILFYVSFYWWGKVENHTFSSLILLYLSSLLTEVGHFYQIYSKILARKLTFVQIRSRQYLTGLWFCCSSSFCLKVLLKVCSVLVLLGTMTPAWSSRENPLRGRHDWNRSFWTKQKSNADVVALLFTGGERVSLTCCKWKETQHLKWKPQRFGKKSM